MSQRRGERIQSGDSTAGHSRSLGAVLLTVFVVSNAGYFLIDPDENQFLPWLALYTLQFAVLAGVLWKPTGSIRLVVLAGIASRVVLWFSVPILEADYFRYLWDGHVFSHGINPFLYAPEHPSLDGLETGYRIFITHAQFSTIYPPAAQYVFWLAHAIAPDSLLGMKIVLTLFDVATGLVLVRWLSERKRPTHDVALYFLNPLVLKEVANSAHVDAVAVFFATAALYLMSRTSRVPLRAWLALALSVASKLYALALVPLFCRVDERFRRHAIYTVALLIALYVPFVGAGEKLFAGTAAFGQYWIFNASVFRMVAFAWELVLPGQGLAPRITVIAAFAALLVWRARALQLPSELPEAGLFAVGSLLLLSPVVNAWYVLWILPLAVLTRSIPWLAFSYLVGFSYSWFYSPELAVYFRIAEYATLFALLFKFRASIFGR